ncbi:MAG: thiamine phosphate synthase [Gaiellaceae bacterium]
MSDLETARRAIEGGATVIQVRLKDRPTEEIAELAAAIGSEARPLHLEVTVNDDVEAARQAGADYVHLGRDDLQRLGGAPHYPFGLSASTVEEAVEAEELGAAYIGAGPVWSTPSKPDAGSPIGLAGLSSMGAVVATPLVAIGGIDSANAGDCIRAGASGVAVIRGVAELPAIRAAVDAAL